MIFDKDSQGSSEIKGLIGFIYKSITFQNLVTYINFAERDVKKVIGATTFQAALDHYESDNYQSGEENDPAHFATLDELVRRIQLPVALLAYRRYVQSSDLTHSDKGRQIFVSEQEKPAFEWMIERDNENLLSLAHEALDNLLEFLDEHIDDTYTPEVPDQGNEGGENEPPEPQPVIPWGTCPEFEATRSLFINTAAEFDQVFPIGKSRLTYLSLVPFIRRIQETEIRSCLTADQYETLREMILDSDLDADYTEILTHVREPLALLTMSVAVKRIAAQLLPEGVFNNVTSGVVKGKTPAPKIDRNEVSANLEKDGLRALARLQEYLNRIALQAAGEEYTVEMPADNFDPTAPYVRV